MVRNTERRVQLADAAVSVLARQGSRGLTHRAVDDEAAVPRGTTSNYFASRDKIIDAILHRISQRLQPSPETIAERADQAPTVDLFASYLCDIVHRLTADRNAAIALFELRLEATRRPHVAEQLASWRREGLQADIAFNKAAGLPGSPGDITLFHYALDGLVLDQVTVPIDPEADPDIIVTTLAHRLLGD